MTERNITIVLSALSTMLIGLGILTEDQVGFLSDTTMLIIASLGTAATAGVGLYNFFTAE